MVYITKKYRSCKHFFPDRQMEFFDYILRKYPPLSLSLFVNRSLTI